MRFIDYEDLYIQFRTAGALRPFGNAVVVDGGYRVTGRWPLGSGCQYSGWIEGGCRILDGDRPRLLPNGTPLTRVLFFSAADCEILDTWYIIGLRADLMRCGVRPCCWAARS
jgi:indole-3-acetate monooxygenase